MAMSRNAQGRWKLDCWGSGEIADIFRSSSEIVENFVGDKPKQDKHPRKGVTVLRC